jgi:hypothetical protein
MVVPVAVPPLIKVQSFMRISLMIGIGGGDGGSPVDHYVDELPSHVTTGFGPRMEFSAAESGSRLRGLPAQVRRPHRDTPLRAAVVVGQCAGSRVTSAGLHREAALVSGKRT